MSIPLANVNTSNTFQTWLDTTNYLATYLSNNIVTVNSSLGTTTGNGYVNGNFGSDILFANTSLRGGNSSTSNTLVISSNVSISSLLNASGLASLNGGLNTTTANASVALNVGAGLAITPFTLVVNSGTIAIGCTALTTSSSFIANNSTLVIGNTTVSVSINSTSFSGTVSNANNALYLGGVAAANYVSIAVLSGYANLTTASFSGAVSAANLTSTTNVATIGTSSYFVSNGNIGLGTNLPAYIIDSSKNSNTIVGYRVLNSNTGTGGYSVYYATTNASTSVIGSSPTLTFAGSFSNNDFAVLTNNIERFRVDTSGYVGLNAPVNQTYRLLSNGDILTHRNGTSGRIYLGNAGSAYLEFNGTNYTLGGTGQLTSGGNMNAPNFVVTSDARLKNNIKDNTKGGLVVDNISTKSYTLVSSENDNNIGFIAQEVLEYIPEAITENENGYLGVKEMPLVAVLWQALKETRQELKDLKQTLGII